MNKGLRSPALSVASSILAGAGPRGKSMRYKFVDNPKRPDYTIVFDTFSGVDTVVAELYNPHARMIYLMYKKAYDRHPLAADEFMYGHIMGYTLMMIHADKYPKVTVSRDGGVVKVRMEHPDGSDEVGVETDTKLEKDLIDRIVPDDFPGEGTPF